MNIVTLLPFIVLIGAMFLMTRSAKKKQQQAVEMRNQMQPGSGVRTIGGMYATVKEVHDDAVVLEVAPGVHAFYAKNSVGAVLDDDEYNRIVHGETDLKVPDDASALTEADEPSDADTPDDARIDLGKKDADADEDAEKAADKAADKGAEADKGADVAEDAAPKKTDGEADSK